MCILLKKYRIYFALVAFGILLHAAINHLGEIWHGFSIICDILSPVLIGALMAFVLNAPVHWFNYQLQKTKVGASWDVKKRHRVSIYLTLIALVALVLVVVLLVVPNTVASLTSAYYTVMEDIPQILAWLDSRNVDTTEIRNILTSVDLTALTNIGNLLSQTFGVASRIAGTVFSFAISAVLALYILFDKHHLKKWAIKILYAFCPEKAPGLIDIYIKLEKSYLDFFTGQIFESCILGCLIFIAMSIARIPYALLIALLTGIFAVVPYLGAWFAGGVGVVFIIFDDPKKALLCAVIYVVVQFIENQFIYPRVVGNKVGLSPLMTLASVVIGGSLMGICGMILFIPLVAVIRDLSVEKINELDEKHGYIAEDETIDEIEDLLME